MVSAVGSPVALVTALLFYFGWVRTVGQARTLGVPVSALSLTTQDYLLRSITALYLPALVALLLIALSVAVHRRVIGWAAGVRHRGSDAPVRRLITALERSWTLWVPLAIILLAWRESRPLALPLCLTLGLVFTGYARALRRGVLREKTSAVVRVVLATMLTLVLFWDTERIALAVGNALAARLVAEEGASVHVTVLSETDLALDLPGITQTLIPGTDGKYRYRYEGLRLFHQSGEDYLLFNTGWTPDSGKVVLLTLDDGLRVEFSR